MGHLGACPPTLPLTPGAIMPDLCLSRSRRLRYFAFFLLYVMQGVPAGFALTAVANYLAARGLPPARIGGFVAVIGLPWAFQFVWGPVLDRFQASTLGRRRPWVILCQGMALLASLGLVLIDDPARQLWAASLAFFVHSVFASVQDASVDAMAIALIRESERGRVNAFMRGGMIAGSASGAAVLSVVMATYGFRIAAVVQTLALLAMTAVTACLRERPGDALWPSFRREPSPAGAGPSVSIGRVFAELFRGLVEPSGLHAFAAIAIVYLAQSVFIRALSIELIQGRGWGDTELSVLTGGVGMVAALVAVLVGGVISDHVGHRRMLLAVMAALAVFLFGFSLISGHWDRPVVRSGLMIWYIFDPLVSVAAMPALMALCRPGVEGSQFTAYMAFVNLCDVAGSFLAGEALRRVSAPTIGLACGVAVAAAFVSIALGSLGRVAKPNPAIGGLG